MQKIKNTILIYIMILYTVNVYSQEASYNRFLHDFPIATYSSLVGNNWKSFYLRNSPIWITPSIENYNIYNKNENSEIIHCIEKNNDKDEDILIFSSIPITNTQYDSITFSTNIFIPEKNNRLDIFISNKEYSYNTSFKTNKSWQNIRVKIPCTNKEDNIIKICLSVKAIKTGDKIYLKNISLPYNDYKNVKDSTEKKSIHEFDKSSGFSIPSTGISKKHLKRLETLCLVWGFMKYYHPDIRKGEYDWNYELIRMLPFVFNDKSYDSFCKDINTFIPQCRIDNKGKIFNNDTIVSQIKKKWINTDILKKNLYKRIYQMNQSGCEDSNIYCVGYLHGDDEEKNEKVIYFPNETSYDNITIKDDGYRILALFRFWNMMYYFHPYMFQKEEFWISNLQNYIRMFADADNVKDFDIACTVVANALKDTHTELYGLKTNVAGTLIWNEHYLPFDFKLIKDDRLLVVKALTHEAERCSLKVGDYILKVNGKSIKEIRDERTRYSNFGKLSLDQYDDAYASFPGDSVRYTIKRDEKEMDININDVNVYWGDFISEKTDTIKMMDNDICYINLGCIPYETLKELLPNIKDKKGIIFDMRGYPDNWNETRKEIARFLYPKQQVTWNYAYADTQYPGTFRKSKYKGTFGENNPEYYKGKSIVLVNGMTMSAAEHVAEIISNSHNSIVIGEQTGGVLGRISYAPFISGRAARFTGTAVYFPNGDCTYPNGIHIDKYVYPMPNDVRNNIDRKIKTATDIINKY